MFSKYVFAAVICMHGLIHFMGFTHAFGYSDPSQFTSEITRQSGLIWLGTGLAFIITVVLILTNKNWVLFGVFTAMVSQALVIYYWQDAKTGTIINFWLLLVAVQTWTTSRFERRMRKEILSVLPQTDLPKDIVREEDLHSLPAVIQNWLKQSGVTGKRKIHCVRLKQKGQMRTKPEGGWMPFTATQYFNADEPSFHWQVDVSRFSVKIMKGRDFFTNGKGYMQIILLSLFKMVDDADNDKINSGSMLRYLAETCWFPSAALHSYIKWEAADDLSAKATMSYKGITVTGLFYFNEKGELKKFSADRFFGTGDTAKIEKWEVETRGYKTFQGINIPTKCKVIWKLPDGDFSWANLEVLAIEYNVNTMYDS